MTPTIPAARLSPCDGGLRRAGSGGRAARAAAHDGVSPVHWCDPGRVARVTPSAMPDALDGAWRDGDAERGWRGPLSAPEAQRRGAEREPLAGAARLSPLPGAGEGTAAGQASWPTKRDDGRGAERRAAQ